MSEFDKIIGYKDEKEELMRLCDALKHREKYTALGISRISGILFNGRPGVGKTLMANCFIKESGRKAFVCRKDKPDGEFVKEIKNVFDEAVKNTPSIVLLDDLDKFANEDDSHKDAEEYITVQACIDEVREKDVFVLATTNGVTRLPESLTRAGRFDTFIYVDVPDEEDAVKIISHYLSQKKYVANIVAIDVVGLLRGRSCAELESVINIAGLYAGYAGKEKIEMDDIVKAALRVIYEAPEKSVPHAPDMLKRVAYHEAGHVVVAEILEEGCVDVVSVRNNWERTCGITCYNSGVRFASSKKEMENRVIAVLAGKAAIDIVFGEADVGCNDDLECAFNIVDDFVDRFCSYGFGCRSDFRSSPDLISRKEARIMADIETYYAEAKNILAQNRDFLDRLATALQHKDVLVRSEIAMIKNKIVK